MKRTIASILAIAMLFCVISVEVLAADKAQEDKIIVRADSILETATGLNDSAIITYANGLFLAKSLSLSKTASQLLISAKTTCVPEVTKCGFTYIKLQRLINGKWSDYSTYCYYDQYANAATKSFSTVVSAPKGYTYRVICEHYAEKTKLLIFKDKETSYNVTSSLNF